MALFAGGGGLELGLSLALGTDYRTIAYVERDATSAAVLAANMERGRLDKAPIWDDVETFTGSVVSPFVDNIDILTAGFPCQPWSVAGQRKGTDDERWLWPLIFRLVREIRPRNIFLENVPGLLHGGIEHVLGDLASVGFDAEWTSVRASDVGAPHRRERVFCLAKLDDSESGREQRVTTNNWSTDRNGDSIGNSGSAKLADSYGGLSDVSIETVRARRTTAVDGSGGTELAESDSGRGREDRSNDILGNSDVGNRNSQPEASRSWNTDSEPGGELGDPQSSRGQRLQERRVSDVGRRGEELGDSTSERPREAGQHIERPAPRATSNRTALGNSDRQGLQGRQQPVGQSSHERPTWPPGPADTDAWSEVDERYWPAKPQIRLLAHGLASWVAGHGIGIFGEIINATREGDSNEVVRDLRNALATEAHEWSLGRLLGVPTEKALLAILCEYQRQRNKVGTSLEGEEVAEVAMRSVWGDKRITRPSHGWTAEEQQSREHSNPMHSLSRLLAQRIGEAWEAYQRENADSLGFGLSRSDQLRILGNGVVPAQAALAFEVLSRRFDIPDHGPAEGEA